MRLLLATTALVAVAGTFVATTAHAADASAAAAALSDADAIIVTGRAEGYKADDSVTATKTPTALLDIPQTISVMTRARMDDQALHGIADVLRYVPGATVGQGEGNRDQITLRGQNTTADFFLDGVRDDVQYYRGLYNIERVEVLKGPFALIFGRGGSGGIINRVQKTPVAGTFRTGATASANSFGAWDVSADINAPVMANAALRLNAFYEQLDNHRDFAGGERYAVNPYLAFDFGQWKLGLSYEYVKDTRLTDRGVPSVATAPGQPNRPVIGHTCTFIGDPVNNRTSLEAHVGKVRLDGDLSENLHWSTTLLYGDYDKYYNNVYASGAATADNGTVPLAGYTDPTTRRNFIAQSNLVWNFDLGPIGNTMLVGLEYGDQRSTNQRRSVAISSTTFDLGNPVYPTFTVGGVTRNTASNVEFVSAYAQDQISLSRYLDVIVGLRYDRFRIKGTDVVAARNFARTDEKVSPRIGVIVKPQENMSLYGSYSQSFLPRSGDQFATLTPVQENLAPEKFTNYEVGAKWDIRPNLSATVAVFQLDRTNATTPDPTDVQKTINVGATRTRGVEVALTGRLLPHWQSSLAYTHQDAKLKGNEAVRLGQVPRHQLALWNRYDFTPMVGAGLGIVHQSSQYAALRTTPETTLLPAFTRVDAALYFNPTERLQLQVNVENVLDTRYFSDAHNNNNISPGAPINARLTARLKF